MAPILFKIPLTIPFFGHVELPIYGFGIMLVLAFIFAPWLAWWRARREGLDGDVILDMGFWIFVAGLVGARLFYCIEYWGTGHPQPLGCLPVLEGRDRLLRRDRRRHRSASSPTDGSTRSRSGPTSTRSRPSIALGTFFGRLGCFLNGCCYGDQCRLPWAVSFPADSPPWMHQVKAGLISAGRDCIAAGPSDPALLGRSTAWSCWSCCRPIIRCGVATAR